MESIFKPLIEWCLHPRILPRTQLCSATVPEVSSLGYRKMVLCEIYAKYGPGKAFRFLWSSLIKKFKGLKN